MRVFGDFFQHPCGIYIGKKNKISGFIQRKEVKSMAVMKINNDKALNEQIQKIDKAPL